MIKLMDNLLDVHDLNVLGKLTINLLPIDV